MKKNNLILAQRWFVRADDDEMACAALIKDEISPNNICFMAQQMAEKYLKGLLVANGQEFEKVHDLTRLTDSLKDYFPMIDGIVNDLAVLSRYYISSRYPGGSAEIFGLTEAKKAFEIAKSVKKFVLSQTFSS